MALVRTATLTEQRGTIIPHANAKHPPAGPSRLADKITHIHDELEIQQAKYVAH